MKNLIKIIILGVPAFLLLSILAAWFNLFVYMMFKIQLNYYLGLVITALLMGAFLWALKESKSEK